MKSTLPYIIVQEKPSCFPVFKQARKELKLFLMSVRNCMPADIHGVKQNGVICPNETLLPNNPGSGLGSLLLGVATLMINSSRMQGNLRSSSRFSIAQRPMPSIMLAGRPRFLVHDSLRCSWLTPPSHCFAWPLATPEASLFLGAKKQEESRERRERFGLDLVLA